MPGTSFIVIKQSTYIFKQEHLRLRFFYHTGKLIKQRSTSIFKTKAVTHHRECLTGRTTDDEIYISLISAGIEVAYISKPIFLFNVIVCKIAFLTFGFDIASKHNPML